MATKSKKGVETPKIFFWAEILATYFFSVDKCPAKIWAKSVTYRSPKWKSYIESPKIEILVFTISTVKIDLSKSIFTDWKIENFTILDLESKDQKCSETARLSEFIIRAAFLILPCV